MKRSKWMMSAALGAMCTLAAGTFAYAEDNGLEVSVENVTVTAGEQAVVAVNLDSNPGIIALTLEVTYDAEKLTLVSYTDSAVGEIFTTDATLTKSQTTDTVPYVLLYEDGTAEGNSIATGALGYFTFDIAEGYIGDIDVSVEVKEAFDFDFTDVDAEDITANAGKIIVEAAPDETEDETDAPTEEETDAPTEEETDAPTEEETDAPTEEETDAPTEEETDAPTEEETDAPAEEETDATEAEPADSGDNGDHANVALLFGAVVLAGVIVTKKFVA